MAKSTLAPRSLLAKEIHESVAGRKTVKLLYTPERHAALCQIAQSVTDYGTSTQFTRTEFSGIDMLENRWTIVLEQETSCLDCGSTYHRTGQYHCPEVNKTDRDE